VHVGLIRTISICIAFACSLPLHALSAAEIVAVRMDSDLQCHGALVAQSRCAGDACLPLTERLSLAAGSDVSLSVDASKHWAITVDSQDCWAAPVVVEDSDTKRIEIDLWPRAAISGTIANGEPATPNHLTAHLSARNSKRIDATVDCSVLKRRWTCHVPAADLDIRLHRDGFAPLYFWNVMPQRGATLEMPQLRFVPGASIAGWVTFPSASAGNAEVELLPAGFTGPERTRHSIGASLTRVNGRGFFQFAGIEPGVYDVIARARGWSPATAKEVRVRAANEEFLRQPLALSSLVSLSVTVHPPLAPNGAPWKITLSRPSPMTRAFGIVRSETLHESGYWSSDDLEADRYQLTLLDSSGSIYASRELQVEGSPRLEFIRVDAVRVRGRLMAGEHPISGKVIFVGDGTRVPMDADEDGNFLGSLPEAGPWPVEIKLNGGGILRKHSVRVDAHDNGEPSDVRIVLPPGSVSGVVVDEDGKPLQARVRLLEGASVIAYAASDSDGRFAIRGLPEKKVIIEAEVPDYGTAVQDHEIIDNPEQNLRIVVSRQQKIAIQLVAIDGRPLSGAMVWQIVPPFWRKVEKVTDRSGIVELALPSSGNVDAVVFASGFAFKLLSFPRDTASGMTIPLQPIGGRIRFEGNELGQWGFIAPEHGSFFPVAYLFFKPNPGAPPLGFSETGFAPDLQAGVYTVCPRATFSNECEQFLLAPGTYVKSAVRPGRREP